MYIWLRKTLLLLAFVAATARAQDSAIFNPGAQPILVLEKGAGEGPAWHPDHGLFFSGEGAITLLGHNGKARVFLKNAGSNGLLFDHEGRLLICQPARRQVSRMDIDDGRLHALTDSYNGKRYNQPNDITIDSKGRIFFSDPRYGNRDGMELTDEKGRRIEGVYRIDPDGMVTRVLTHEVDRPNGLLVTPDDEYLYVADNHNNTRGASRKLWRFPLTPSGDVAAEKGKLLFDWKNSRGPDGMVLDRAGRLYVAGGLNKPNPPVETDELKGGVYVFSPEGKLIDFVAIPRDEVTNCTFGGEDLKTLFITAGGTLWSIRTNAAGHMPWPK